MKKFIIKVNGSEYEVEVEEVRQDGMEGQAIPEIKTVNPVSAQTAPAASPAKGNGKSNNANKNNKNNNNAIPAGARIIDSPMPGVIVDISVNEGDTVKKGDVLLILEAMKMENEIVSPVDGNITSVNVSKGASVNAGDVLLSIG